MTSDCLKDRIMEKNETTRQNNNDRIHHSEAEATTKHIHWDKIRVSPQNKKRAIAISSLVRRALLL